MLYITTRDSKDAFTAYKTLMNDCSVDGGQYVPFRFVQYSHSEIVALKQKSFGQIVAEILNLFFSARISGWDVDFTVGRNPVKIVPLIHKISVAETWHNLQSDYNYILENLFKLVCKKNTPDKITSWAKIAIEIATLFGLYAELMRGDVIFPGEEIDIALPTKNLSDTAAVLYAKKMGLPIHTLIFCCDEDSPVWDFIRRGTLTSSGVKKMDAERLLQLKFGCDSALAFCEARNNGKSFTISEELLPEFNSDLYATAISAARIPSVINSVERTDGYTISADAAFAYGGLQDYRASIGNNNPTLLLSLKAAKQ